MLSSDRCQECREALPSQDVECTEGPGLCAHLITLLSILLILASLPLSLVFVVKVVQVRTQYYTAIHILNLDFY